jgi:hypothetical protein
MHIEQKVNIHNRFDIHIDNIETGEHREIEAYNIVLDQMWTRLCGGSTYFVNIHFGTGVGIPTAGRTTLFTHLGTKAAVDDEVVKALPVSRWKRKIVLNPEEFVGSTISEVGIAFGGTNTNLVTHAMLKDAEGNPITITKTSTDVVTIFATVFVKMESLMDSIRLAAPTLNNLINYLFGSSAPGGTFGLLPGKGIGNRIGSSPTPTWSADVPAKKRKTNTVRFDINTGNGHIQGLDFTNLFNVSFPTIGVFENFNYLNVAIGNGDGIKTSYEMPSKNIFQDSLIIKINGTERTVTKKRLAKYNFMHDIIGNWPSNAASEDAHYSRDGKLIGFAHRHSPYFSIFDSETLLRTRPLNPIPPSNDRGTSIAMNEDGSRLVVTYSGVPYVDIYTWDGSKYVSAPKPTYGGEPIYAALSSDGLVLAYGTNSYNYISVWDWVDNTWVPRPNIVFNPTTTSVRNIVMSDDGTVIGISHNGNIGLNVFDWDGNAWTQRATPPGSIAKFSLLSCSPDGTNILYRLLDNKIAESIWEAGVWNTTVIDYTSRFADATWVMGSIMSRNCDRIALFHNLVGCGMYSKIDGVWTWAGMVGTVVTNRTATRFSPDSTKLVGMGISLAALYDIEPRDTIIECIPAPAIGEAITADYTVDGLHKTNQYVIDVSCAIQFGEGV